jgi:3-deoxy-7-phosphoheptulonate synthase
MRDMIVIMKQGASSTQIANVTARIQQFGCQAHISEGKERTIIGVVGNGRPLDREQIERWDGVEPSLKSAAYRSAGPSWS